MTYYPSVGARILGADVAAKRKEEQRNLFDEGARRRDVGHESALSHGFVTTVRCAILHIARTQDRFTSEDVVAILPAATVDALAAFPNALGACIRAEALAGSIVATDVTRHATRPEARKRRLVVWRKGDL